ncbi:hypothetical protein, conserved [Eimeria maxima]|uniref:Uncharacterized protein n=1 Tax=Eimeria maxima TaxID=5804 RepID=U6ME52_EIMMA|nr:hypothetical protein, conserved [Eimeria maxima]CDJ60724.1 hypothetical protein, conserved [Eimeria maxima]
MGSVIGRENAETLSYAVIREAPNYEIRHYEATPIIETTWGEDSRQSFYRLANYIGVFDKPMNEGAKKIPMTTPVECIVKGDGFEAMRFFPPKATAAAALPPPLSNEVQLKKTEERFVAARRFSGSVDLDKTITQPPLRQQILLLLRSLLQDGLITCSSSGSGGGGGGGRDGSNSPCSTDDDELFKQLEQGKIKDTSENKEIQVTLELYNSPFCLPIFRRNEFWVHLPRNAALNK